MKTEMLMPQMGESIAEATVLKWLKQVGEKVEKDETILEISTDKVDSEIPAPESGILVEIIAQEGDTVAVKSVVAIIETDAAAAAEHTSSRPADRAPSKKAPAKSAPKKEETTSDRPADRAPSSAPTGKSVDMVMPQMGESIAEATIIKWHKREGDEVDKDEMILEISTDKVDSEIPSPASGIISKIVAGEGDTVAVKSVIAVISETAASGSAAQPQASAAPSPAAPSSAPAPQATQAIPAHVGSRFYSPLVRNVAAQYGLSPNELSQVAGTGANGRVTKDDVLNYIKFRPAGGVAPAAAPQAKGPKLPAAQPKPAYGEDGLRVEEMTKMRKIIAKHMVDSKSTSPHVYTVAEVDVTNIAKWRKKNQPAFLAREGFKLSFTPFFLEAAVMALSNFPGVNASVDGDTIVYKRDINLGCAVSLGDNGLGGLIVPVIKNAAELNLTGLARNLKDIAERARDKKLSPTDIQGGTFTITNLGVFGSIIGYPIINQPQLAILGLGAIKKRPMVVNDAIAIRDIVYLTLSYDHRVVDGALGGQFLQYISKYLEGWDMSRGI